MHQSKSICPYCAKKFKDNRGLSGHMRYLHKDEAPYKPTPVKNKGKKQWPLKKSKTCPHCPKAYKNVGALRNHISAIHGEALTANSKPKSHLELAIDETRDELQQLTERSDELHDMLDALMGAQDIIKSRSRHAAVKR